MMKDLALETSKYLFLRTIWRILPIFLVVVAVGYVSVVELDWSSHRGKIQAIVVMLLFPVVFFDQILILIRSAFGLPILYVRDGSVIYLTSLRKSIRVESVKDIQAQSFFGEKIVVIFARGATLKVPAYLFDPKPEEVVARLRACIISSTGH